MWQPTQKGTFAYCVLIFALNGKFIAVPEAFLCCCYNLFVWVWVYLYVGVVRMCVQCVYMCVRKRPAPGLMCWSDILPWSFDPCLAVSDPW